MRWKPFIIGWILALAAFLFAQRRAPVGPPPQTLFSSVVDLTHTVDAHTASSPGRTGAFSGLMTVDKNGFFEAGVRVPQRFATTVEAPAASLSGAWTVDQIPTDHLLGPLVVLDVISKAAGNPNYEVSIEDIARWEEVNGPVPPGAIVIARTGWPANARAHHAGWSPDAARFLVEARSVYALGTDAPSLDGSTSDGSPVSHYLAVHNVYGLTNVANLSHAPHSGAVLVVAPAHVQAAASAPARVLALIRISLDSSQPAL